MSGKYASSRPTSAIDRLGLGQNAATVDEITARFDGFAAA
jgi:hypothetical protein